jgi:hypothetical protein
LLGDINLTVDDVHNAMKRLLGGEAARDDYSDYRSWAKKRGHDNDVIRYDWVVNYLADNCDDDVIEVVGEIVAKHVLILPIYLYDHSGITVSHGGFGCSWDSGKVGYHYVTAATIASEWDGDWGKARNYLKCELSTYDDYLTGNVWGFTLESSDEDCEGCEELCDCCEWNHAESCWGFVGYGTNADLADSIVEHIGSEFKQLAIDACNARDEWHYLTACTN